MSSIIVLSHVNMGQYALYTSVVRLISIKVTYIYAIDGLENRSHHVNSATLPLIGLQELAEIVRG
jgi:hypothetical protein